MTEKIEAWLYEGLSRKIVVRPDQVSWFEVSGTEDNCIVYIHLIGETPSELGPSLFVVGKAAVQFLRWIQNYWDIKVIYEADNSGKQSDNQLSVPDDSDQPLPAVS